jgi:hypothetical protein
MITEELQALYEEETNLRNWEAWEGWIECIETDPVL